MKVYSFLLETFKDSSQHSHNLVLFFFLSLHTPLGHLRAFGTVCLNSGKFSFTCKELLLVHFVLLHYSSSL